MQKNKKSIKYTNSLSNQLKQMKYSSKYEIKNRNDKLFNISIFD